MYIKKIICSLLVLIMLSYFIPESVVVMAEDYSYLVFTYNSTYNGYEVNLAENYTDLCPENLIIPEKYNDNDQYGEDYITYLV